MKSIIFLVTILAIASARQVNPWDVYESFSTKLGLTQKQQEGFQACAIELRNAALPLFAGGKAATQARLLSFIFADDTKHREVISSIIQKVQTGLPACRQFVLDVASVFGKATLSVDEHYVAHNQLARLRFSKYFDEISSAFISIVEAKQRGDGQVVGEKLATIVQLLTGISHPETIVDYYMTYAENHKDVIEIQVLETDRLIQQTINNAAKELGSNKEISEERAKELKESIIAFVQAYINAIKKDRFVTNFVEEEVLLLGTVRDLIKTGGVVAENIDSIVHQLFGFHVTLTKENAKFAISILLRNYYLRLPTIGRRSVDLQMELQRRHPAAAGKALAGLIRAYVEYK